MGLTRIRQQVGACRQFLPASTVPLRAGRKLRKNLQDERTVQDAVAQMRFLTEMVQPDAPLELLAQRYLAYQRWWDEAIWHKAQLRAAMPIKGIESLVRHDGGALVHIMHHGSFDAIARSLAATGMHVYVLSHHRFHAERPTPRDRQLTRTNLPNVTHFSTTEGTRSVVERLRAGQLVEAASDQPGHTHVRFAGRDLLASSGALRAAWTAGTPVWLLTSEFEGDDESMVLEGPLSPGDFPDFDAFHAHVFAHHEESILRRPDRMHDPLGKFGIPAAEGVAS